jgi:hypothetical protein
MEKPIEIFISTKKDNLKTSMDTIFDSPDPGQVIHYHENDDTIYMEVVGTWVTYKRVLDSGEFLSVEHFEDEKDEGPSKYWVSTSTAGGDPNYTNYNG